MRELLHPLAFIENFSGFQSQDEHKRFVNQYVRLVHHQTDCKGTKSYKSCKVFDDKKHSRTKDFVNLQSEQTTKHTIFYG